MGLESSELHKTRSPQIPCLQVLRIVPKHLRWSTKAQQVTHMASDQHVTATLHFRIESQTLQEQAVQHCLITAAHMIHMGLLCETGNLQVVQHCSMKSRSTRFHAGMQLGWLKTDHL